MYIDSVRVPSVVTRRDEVEVPLLGVVDARRVLSLSFSSVAFDCRGFCVRARIHTHDPFKDHRVLQPRCVVLCYRRLVLILPDTFPTGGSH